MIGTEFEEIESGESDAYEAGEAELDLTDDDSLPWLESDEEESGGGFDFIQFVGFFVILLALLGAMIGGIWYLSNRTKAPELVADGSTIEAPEGPYKVKPKDRGGKEFDGTGNVAPAVGEGQSREGRLAESGETPKEEITPPKPSVDTRSTDEASGSGAESASASAAGVGVQVGAYGSRTRAEQGWAELTRSSAALDGVKYRIVKGQADIGTVYRLQALASDRASADRLCAALKADGLPCQVKP